MFFVRIGWGNSARAPGSRVFHAGNLACLFIEQPPGQYSWLSFCQQQEKQQRVEHQRCNDQQFDA